MPRNVLANSLKIYQVGQISASRSGLHGSNQNQHMYLNGFQMNAVLTQYASSTQNGHLEVHYCNVMFLKELSVLALNMLLYDNE